MAMLQLANKANDLPFNRQDEFMLKGFATQMAVLLQSAQLHDHVTTCQQNLESLIFCLDEIHNHHCMDPAKNTALHRWVEASALHFIKADSVSMFWLNGDGRAVHSNGLVVSSPNGVGHVVSSGQSYMQGGCASRNPSPECVLLYVPVKNISGVVAVLEAKGQEARRCVPGDVSFTKQEIAVLEEFAYHVGIFLEYALESEPAQN